MKLMLILLFLAVSWAQDVARFMVTPSTVLKTQTATVFTSSLATSFCASISGPVSACRRRRGVPEQPNEILTTTEKIQPTTTMKIETTRRPLFPINPPIVQVPPAIQDSQGMIEVRLSGFNDICQARVASPFLFGINWASLLRVTVVYTSTTTVSVTSTTAGGTVTKSFVISGCTPSPLPYPTC